MSEAFVVDASVAMAWCFLDEATTTTAKLLEDAAAEALLVPDWWYLELTNALWVAEKRGRLSDQKVGEFIRLINSLQVTVDAEGSQRAFEHLLPLCRTYQLTAYDALYLDLAIRRRLPLATLDEPLRKAAKKAGVAVLGK